MKNLAAVLAVGALVGSLHADEPAKEAVPPVLQFTMKNIAGDDVPLSRYQGKVVLMVNVASRCGNTKQYAALQKAHEKYAEQGLAILGFPANNFRGQEPGSDAEIATFCRENYGVTFDLFSKISVKGEDIAPLYAFLTSPDTNPASPGDITWNFEKFLIARDGTIAARFAPRTPPDAPEVVAAVEAELAKPAL